MRILKPEVEVQAVLSILQSSDTIKYELISALKPEHFAYDQMSIAYELISKLLKSSSGLPTMETFLKTPELPEATANILANPVAGTVVTTKEDAAHLVSILEYYRKIRRCYEMTLAVSAKMKEDGPADVADIQSDLEGALNDLNQGTAKEKYHNIGMGGDADFLIDNLLNEEKPKLIPSTFDNFDSKVGGFGRQDFVILASHAKGGKSLTALNMLINQYHKHNLDVILISMEMTDAEVADRLISSITGIEHSKIRLKELSPMERKIIAEKWKEFNDHGKKNNCRFTIWDTSPGLTTTEVKMKLKNRGYDVVCIDYINLMGVAEKGKPDWERLSILGRELKQATKEIDTLIMAPTQMNDDGDVRYSKALKEHANTIWRWFFKEESRATHQIRVDQLVVRGWGAFPFMLREDFERSTICDGAAFVPGEGDEADHKQNLSKMYNDD